MAAALWSEDAGDLAAALGRIRSAASRAAAAAAEEEEEDWAAAAGGPRSRSER